MSDERIDVFDSRFLKVGTATHTEVHRDGLWHQTFHCWLIERDSGRVVFQKRSLRKSLFPGMLDVSVAGHCGAGELPTAALIREGQEELGIDIAIEALVPLGIRRVSYTSGAMTNREFQHIFIGYLPCSLKDLRFEDGEVDAAVLLSTDDYDRITNGAIINAEGWDGLKRILLPIAASDFIADEDDYLPTIVRLAHVPGELATTGTVFHHLNSR